MFISTKINSNTSHTGSYNIFYTAQDTQTIIKVTCCIKLNGILRDVTCHGYLSEAIGREAKLRVVEQTVIARPCKLYANEFEYFFCLDKNFPQRVRHGYMGVGKILGVKRDSNHNIQALLLRFPAQGVVRRMRRDRRINWNPEYSKTSGVMCIDRIPETKHDLKELVQNHYHLAALRSQIINISAAGACILLPDFSGLKSLSTDSGLMLYIISDEFSVLDATYVFLCKKVGVTSSGVIGALKLRTQFTHELNLRNSDCCLNWVEISNCGSARLERLIHNICSDEPEPTFPDQI